MQYDCFRRTEFFQRDEAFLAPMATPFHATER
jgi:hypothetical protein